MRFLKLASNWLDRKEGDEFTLWLRPYFARLVEGMPVTEAELIEAFRARHGRAPEAYDWDLPE